MSQRPASSAPATPRSANPGQPHSLPLWQLLSRCAEAVAAVRQGQSLTDVLAALPPAERPGTQALSFAVLRRLGTALALRQALVPKAPAPWVDGLLLSALALACGDGYARHTLVDQAVDACKRRARPASGLVNAVLRRFLREEADLLAALEDDDVAHFNHPTWWIRRLQRDWPEHWQAMLMANQSQPPMTLRANVRHGSSAAYRARLVEAGLLAPDGAPALAPEGFDPIVLPRGVPVQQLPGFADGDASVQDAAAQLAAPLLVHAGGRTLPAGARVLDACAAPGGKTAHLLELADCDGTARDSDPQRLVRVNETLQRLGLGPNEHARTVAADASQPATWWDGQAFDAILLDAPCSASGIVRRHPDVRWLRRESDLTALARTQDALLDALWPLLKPGGHLLYCTCSIFRIEGQERIDAFLQRTPGARALPSPGHLRPVVEYLDPIAAPASRGMGDGFFYALLSKPS
ncbi:MAG: 16S rRNA (cytosine(967)-C(5))-methyltransferase RsmB [Aquabacterium sp.]|uniref:16S rRNA (cytosine(967)-C(5))-methyltransferase RsmB n=1 Tax=Aquabacterium sp. TaxID=1872578 RepID=UPI001DA2A030|nr:16S rRNA (cytosine(967)-C(5))-methyltransferase RsmB [Aquabacterium sp.]MBT9611040.1 16S rRNA (cytosine(967)-C(5))-methyltransferase RsmB [Aquabacterium sp.]